MSNVTMDNQQVKDTLNWLAGFFDGEGHVGLALNTSKGYDRFAPQINLVNTYLPVMEEVSHFLLYLGIKHYRWETKPHTVHKTRYYIRIGTMKHCKTFCILIKPFLRLKHEQCDLLLEFVNTRATQYTSTSHRDYEIYHKLRTLNHKGNDVYEPSEIIRQTVYEVVEHTSLDDFLNR